MAELDPQLPFIQIHRSVGIKAASLAPLYGLTYQHVRGALECFWEALADRRILSGKTELVFTTAELSRRLALAFGRAVELEPLVDVGLLEPRPNGCFRVRGMSRYLDAEATRAARIAQRRGSKFSEPVCPTPVGPQSDPSPTPLGPQSDPSPTPVGPHRGERLEDRGESKDLAGKPAVAPPKAPKAKAKRAPQPPSPWIETWEGFQDQRLDTMLALGLSDEPQAEVMNYGRLTNTLRNATNLLHEWDQDPNNNGPESPLLALVWDTWMDDSWARTLEPPFAINAFASPQVLRRLYEAWCKAAGAA